MRSKAMLLNDGHVGADAHHIGLDAIQRYAESLENWISLSLTQCR